MYVAMYAERVVNFTPKISSAGMTMVTILAILAYYTTKVLHFKKEKGEF